MRGEGTIAQTFCQIPQCTPFGVTGSSTLLTKHPGTWTSHAVSCRGPLQVPPERVVLSASCGCMLSCLPPLITVHPRQGRGVAAPVGGVDAVEHGFELVNLTSRKGTVFMWFASVYVHFIRTYSCSSPANCQSRGLIREHSLFLLHIPHLRCRPSRVSVLRCGRRC